jgi:polysaccharide biosynthesis transport protein
MSKIMSKVIFPSSPLSVLRRHFWVALFMFISVTAGTTALSLALSPRLYETSARLIVGEKDVGISALGQELTEINTQAPGKAADPVATQSELVESQKVLERARTIIQQSNSIPTENLPKIWELRRSLTVDIVPATNILEITYRGPDPQLAANLLNAIAQAMVEENIESIRSQASALRGAVEKEIIEQQAKLRRAEAIESQYRARNGIVSIEAQSESLIKSVADLEDQERQLRALLQETTIKGGLLQQVTGANTPAQAYTTVRAGQNEDLKALQEKLTSLEVDIVEARSRLGDQHPDYLALLQRRDELQALYNQQASQADPGADPGAQDAANAASNQLSQDLMSSYITGEIDRQALIGKLALVEADLSSLRSRVALLPAYRQPLAAYAREQAEAADALKILNSKLEEARIAEGQSLSNIRIVGLAAAPSASDPVSPKPLAILTIGIVTGLILAGGTVLLLELLDPTLRSPAEAETVLDLPVLEVLPELTPATSTLVNLEHFLDNPDQIEPYRRLIKALESLSEPKAQVFVFSSVLAGEGKSAVVLHLAAVAAMLSRRTLIVDADLRQPLQHLLLEVPAYPGLTEAVNGSCSFLHAVKSTSIENLSVLPCGQLSTRPSALIETAAMRTLLEEASIHYDYVIIDASPMGICADAATLRQSASGLVLIVQPHITRRDTLLQVVSDLQRSGTPPLGLVMNQAVLPLEKAPSQSSSVELGQMLVSLPNRATANNSKKNASSSSRL